MGSPANAVQKIGKAAADTFGSIKNDPLGALVSLGTLGLGTAGVSGTIQAGIRIRDDQRDQASGMAQSEQDKAAAAERQAVNASVKEPDAVAMERRRRATLAAGKGRSGTILTGGTSLGSADTAGKILLGM